MFYPRYKEVFHAQYDFSSNVFSTKTGHFTQVIWKDTTELGIGFAKSVKNNMTKYYVVGRYRKPGNIRGQYIDNVMKGVIEFTVWNCKEKIVVMRNGRAMAQVSTCSSAKKAKLSKHICTG